MTEKPLFIPLITKYYDAFKDGSKTVEYRKHGARWNAKTCRVGREVTLSKGYGKANRIKGIVKSFRVQNGGKFQPQHKKALTEIYGSFDMEIAIIGIGIIESFNREAFKEHLIQCKMAEMSKLSAFQLDEAIGNGGISMDEIINESFKPTEVIEMLRDFIND